MTQCRAAVDNQKQINIVMLRIIIMAIKINFESSLQKLEEAVEQLESGDLTLDQALKVFSSGVKQAETCRKSLEKVELQVEQLLQQEDGTLQREPFNG